MSEPNPYTPPETRTAPESPDGWQIDGNSLLVKDGTTLPEVDIETGEADDSMEKTKLGIDVSTFGLVRNTALLILAFSVARIGGNPLVVFAFIVSYLIGVRVFNKMTWPRSGTAITEFLGATRRNGQFARRKHRLMCRMLLTVIMLGSVFLLTRSPEHQRLLFVIFPSGLLAAVALAFWGWRERSKIKLEAAQAGWVRVSPVHPDALAYLRALKDSPDATGESTLTAIK